MSIPSVTRADEGLNDDSPPVPKFLRDFRLAWHAAAAGGPRPDIGEFLLRAPDEVRGRLRHDLVREDITRRKAARETPGAIDYLSRFPDLDLRWLAAVLEDECATLPPLERSAFSTASKAPTPTPTSIRVRCPSCHNPIQLSRHKGEGVQCPVCGSVFRVEDTSITSTQVGMQQLGKFQLLERVGLGGFGAVWKARDVELERTVALKIAHESLMSAAEGKERFLREARAAAQLRHPNIVTVHEVADLEGKPAIVSDFVAGVPLRDLMDSRPLTFRETAALVAVIADALDYAHSVLQAAFSPDSRRVIIVTGKTGLVRGKNAVQVLDCDSGRPLSPPFVQEAWVNRTAFSPDGHRAVMASGDNTAHVWDVDNGRPLSPPLQHPWSVNDAAFSPDGRRIVTVSGSTARVWDVASGRSTCPPLQHKKRVACARFSPDGRRVITASYDHTAQVWDVDNGRPVSRLLGHGREVIEAAFDPNGGRVVTASWDGSARIWDVASGKPLSPPLQHQDEIVHATFSPDGRHVLTASTDGTARLWDSDSSHPLSPPFQHEGPLTYAAFSPDGTRIVTAAYARDIHGIRRQNTLRVWDGHTGRPRSLPLRHQDLVNDAAFSPDSLRVVTASQDKTARVWEALTGRPLSAPFQHPLWVNHAAFSPDGLQVITDSADNVSRVWDVESGELVSTARQATPVVNPAAFSPDHRRLVMARGDYTARVWEADSGGPISPPLPHQGAVQDAEFSPDGQRVVTASMDKTARVWDPDSGEPLSPPLEHQGPVGQAAFSPDSRCVVTASWDNTARIWDADTGRPLSPPLQHQGPVTHAAFSPDGRLVITAGQDRTGQVWDVSPDERPTADLVAVVHLLRGRRLDETGGEVVLDITTLAKEWQDLRSRNSKELEGAKPKR